MFMKIVAPLLALLCSANGGHWSYEGETGPANWAKMYPEYCDGKSQSPVNIQTSDVKCTDPDVEFNGYRYNLLRDLLNPAEITNNGHTAQVSNARFPASITTRFDNTGNKFNLLQFHFHWGPNSTVGSEHTVDGKSYPLELHFVHANEKYKGTTDYMKEKDGLTVVGVLFKLSPTDNMNLAPITNALSSIETAGSVSNLGLLSLINLQSLSQLLPHNLKAYHYKGSLTTPTCNEVVNWVVLANPIPVSERQLNQFRSLREGDASSNRITENFRPTLPLNGREVCKTKGVLRS